VVRAGKVRYCRWLDAYAREIVTGTASEMSGSPAYKSVGWRSIHASWRPEAYDIPANRTVELYSSGVIMLCLFHDCEFMCD